MVITSIQDQTLSFEQVRRCLWDWVGRTHKELHVV